ncbi:hypothetical protein D3C74_497560 [compost metagenome]
MKEITIPSSWRKLIFSFNKKTDKQIVSSGLVAVIKEVLMGLVTANPLNRKIFIKKIPMIPIMR